MRITEIRPSGATEIHDNILGDVEIVVDYTENEIRISAASDVNQHDVIRYVKSKYPYNGNVAVHNVNGYIYIVLKIQQ